MQIRVKTVGQVKKKHFNKNIYIVIKWWRDKVMKYWDTFFVIGKARLLHNIAYNTGNVSAKYS